MHGFRQRWPSQDRFITGGITTTIYCENRIKMTIMTKKLTINCKETGKFNKSKNQHREEFFLFVLCEWFEISLYKVTYNSK